ncbi:hypothetical protein Pelo_912 [Pelomyxa schiedti]|nr:hypothetical protein Pelo_912 [Pelomyxa schiedti]
MTHSSTPLTTKQDKGVAAVTVDHIKSVSRNNQSVDRRRMPMNHEEVCGGGVLLPRAQRFVFLEPLLTFVFWFASHDSVALEMLLNALFMWFMPYHQALFSLQSVLHCSSYCCIMLASVKRIGPNKHALQQLC